VPTAKTEVQKSLYMSSMSSLFFQYGVTASSVFQSVKFQ
jgi:hypothetical protein